MPSLHPISRSGPQNPIADAASSDLARRDEDHLAVITASLRSQIQTATQQFDFLGTFSASDHEAKTTRDAIDLSFQALRRAKALISVLDDPSPMH